MSGMWVVSAVGGAVRETYGCCQGWQVHGRKNSGSTGGAVGTGAGGDAGAVGDARKGVEIR